MGLNYSPNFEAPLRVEEEFVEQFYAAYKDFANVRIYIFFLFLFKHLTPIFFLINRF